MLHKVLVANRGEIAVRVIRACRDLGLRSVAVYSEADAGALHVRLADEAWPVGPAPARESYLDVEALLGAARRSGADAVHPGYGFLSENGDFADACEAAGLVWIGPPGAVIRAMGDKVTARRAMEAAGVPIVPGTTERLEAAAAVEEARRVGYPLMVKASAGGGGRGLRLVEREEELAAALERAASEAEASFGDGGLYLERRLERPRHVEVQLLADAHGHVLHLFERECSVQRRHQKVLEEAPAPGLPAATRAALGEAAVQAARALGYRGAGTVEFLLDEDGAFYFLEMNTRIQVEHPVTELVTGVDLVQWQLRIAAGEALALRQEELALRGHAVEARIYAEDPAKRFLPSPGRLGAFRAPDGPGVRVDAGVEAGGDVSQHYDPMIAKLVAWGADREEALARLDRALAEFLVGGVKTSIPFHRWLLRHPDFRAARVDTASVDRWLVEGAPVHEEPGAARAARLLAAAACAEGSEAPCTVTVGGAGEPALTVTVASAPDGRARFSSEEGEVLARVEEAAPGVVTLIEDGTRFTAALTRRPKGFDVALQGQHYALRVALQEPA